MNLPPSAARHAPPIISKATLLTLHRWLALTFAPLLLLQALTGAALLFHGPLARAIDPSGMVVRASGPTAAVATLMASAEARLAGYRVRRMFFPATPDDTIFVELAGSDDSRRFASLDPASSEVLAAGSVWRFPMEVALRLHYRLMDGRLGFAVILANGLALTLLACSGLGFWWPGRGRVVKSLAIKKTAPGRIRLRLWHRSAGVTASALVLFTATTGVLLAAPSLFESAGPPVSVPATAPSSDALDRAIALAQAAFPGARLRDIRFPPADRIDVNFFAPERNPRAVHMVSVALSQPAVLGRTAAARNDILWMEVLPLHSGDSFGLAGRMVLLAEALALAFLAISGPLMWWCTRRARRKAR